VPKCIRTLKKQIDFYDKTILSILNNDFSGFPAGYKEGDYKICVLLYDNFKRETTRLEFKRINLSLDNKQYDIVLILEKDDWTIFLNERFQLFSASESDPVGLSHYLPSLCQEIENTGFNELKTSINIKIEQQEAQTFMLQTSLTKSFNKDYFIILLTASSVLLRKKEKRSLINLMKIISHE
jgi:hypothetical protein